MKKLIRVYKPATQEYLALIPNTESEYAKCLLILLFLGAEYSEEEYSEERSEND